MQWLKDFVNSFFDLLLTPLGWVIDGIIYFVKTFFYILFDGFLFTISTFVSALDLSVLAFNQFAEWTSLPPQLIYVVNQISLPQGVSLIIGAILIRLTLNLIPTWATRI